MLEARSILAFQKLKHSEQVRSRALEFTNSPIFSAGERPEPNNFPNALKFSPSAFVCKKKKQLPDTPARLIPADVVRHAPY